MSNNRKRLGVLGGMGPMATVYFYELLTRHTLAASDQDHLDAVISSRASTPDRTACLLGGSAESPLPAMLEDLAHLVAWGVGVVAVPCNTSHAFYDELAASTAVPVLNMVALTVDKALEMGCARLGVLATEGTVSAGVYQRVCRARGLPCEVPGPEAQAALMRLIYEDIKAGRPPDMQRLRFAAGELLDAGCQRLVLGCTELSLLKKAGGLSEPVIDSMEVLAEAAILACGASAAGFTWDAD